MTDSAPTLPHPQLINGLNYIPAPSPSSYTEFSFLLPEGTSIPSFWGSTRVYDFSPTAAPTARRVLLLHGGGSPTLGVAPLAHKLAAAGHHVVGYDLWGHGLSSTPLATHTPGLLHEQLLEVLSYLKWNTVNLIGFSMGGSIAATFAALHPHAVESAVLVAPAGLLRKKERGLFDGLLFEGGWGREFLSRRKIMRFINGSDLRVKEGWKERVLKGEPLETIAVENWEREKHGGHVASLVNMFRYAGVYDMHEFYGVLARSAVRVLVVLGEKDDVFGPGKLRGELDGLGWKGEIKVVVGATHQLVRTHVKEVAGLVSDFLGSCEGKVLV